MASCWRENTAQPSAAATSDPVLCTGESYAGHLVHFDEGDAFPDVAVGQFLEAGLAVDESILLIATPAHTALLRARLAAGGAPVSALERSDRLLQRDATVNLEAFMVGHLPEPARFAAVIGGALDAAASASPVGKVRVYAECAAILAARENLAAAVAVERLWTQACAQRGCALYCAYPSRRLAHPSSAERLGQVCDAREQLAPVAAPLDGPEVHARCVAILRQHVSALEAEITARRRTEARLGRLARLSDVLATSLDYETTLDNVIALALPELGDFGFLDVIEDGGRVRRVARAGGDPMIEALLMEARWLGAVVDHSCGSDGTALHPRIDDAWLQRMTPDQEKLALLRRLAPCSMVSVPLAYEGRILGRLALFHGRSERRHTAADLELSQEMARRAAAFVENATLYRERADALRRMADADRRKEEFLAMLGHELRNPLAPIAVAVELMEARGDHGSARERAVIRRQTAHLKRLLDDLLDASRITRGTVDLCTEPIEIAIPLFRAIEVATPLIERRSHRLLVEAPRSGLLVNGDAFRLHQAFSNLLGNAATYTSPGGQITVTARRHEGDVVVEVTDTGSGIAPERLPAIFDAFVQGDRALDRAQGGLGLGLMLVKTFVELHGGSVSVDSAGVGQGSAFTVRVPALASTTTSSVTPPSEASSDAPTTTRKHVLIVDDNRDAVDLLAEWLEHAGYHISVAYDGPEALQRAAASPPDVGLIDIGLPVMDGYELASRLRAARPDRELRLIALTGYGQDSDRERSRRVGFDRHLVKPVDLDTLREALES